MRNAQLLLPLVLFATVSFALSAHAAPECGLLGGIGNTTFTECPDGYQQCPITREQAYASYGTRKATCERNPVTQPTPSAGGNTLTLGAGQSTPTPGAGQNTYSGFLKNPLGDDTTTLNDLLAKILNVIVQIGVVVLTMMLVYCGFLFVTAQGNPENISKARSALIWTIIGGFLVLGAEVIAEAIKSTAEAL